MQDYNTIIGTIQMRLNKCPTRSVMDRYKIGSGTVALIMSRYESGGFSIEDLRMMPPKEVESFSIRRQICSERIFLYRIVSIIMTVFIPQAVK